VPHHPTTTVVIGGKPIDVDAGIAADIAAINSRGFSTWVSCQGDDGTPGSPVRRAYIGFAGAPTGQLASAFAAARAAGLEISERCIYAAPSDHHDAAREVATTADQRAWNAAFRRFLRDLGAGNLDGTGERYRTPWYVHDCIHDEHGACVDTVLMPAYHAWRAQGRTLRILCAGDQDRPTDRPIVAAVTRWQPQGEIPSALRTALEAIRFEVRPFGVYTLRDVAGSHRDYFIAVSPERLIAMNRAFKQVLLDYAAGHIEAPDAYERLVRREQRHVRQLR
jgi:hypothetical protein